MIRAPVLALVAAVAAAPASAEPGDVRWYAERHAERRAKLQWCYGDATRRATRECENAEAASAVEHMSPNHPWLRGQTVFPDSSAPRRAPPAEAVPVPMPPAAPREDAPREPRRRAT